MKTWLAGLGRSWMLRATIGLVLLMGFLELGSARPRGAARDNQRALARLPDRLSRFGQRLGSVAGRVGDRLVRLRGAERSLARVEGLWEKGELVRGLGILRRTLKSKRLSDNQRGRALLYVGTIQSRLGNIGQAMRAFSGLLHIKPDFRLPPGVGGEIALNFQAAQGLRYTTSMRGENFSAELPRFSLLNRLRDAKYKLQLKVGSFVLSRPRLLKAYASTVGRFNIWRALNTLELHGIPRFKVHLEANNRDPSSTGRAHFNGDVYIDHGNVITYRTTLHALSHEAYHINFPISATAEYGKVLDQFNRVADRVGSIRQAARGLSKHTPAERVQRHRLARELSQARRELNQARRTLRDLHVHEEGLAEQFAGQIFGRHNLPLSGEVLSISMGTPDRLHPHPLQDKGYFLQGALQGIHEYAGLSGW